MPRPKKERFPCEECGRITSRNTNYSDLNNAYLCEGCRNLYRDNPFCYIPPIGEVHYDENGKIICHICGRGGFDKLTAHLIQRHKITALEYKDKFGLNRTQHLTSYSFHEYCKNKGVGIDKDRLLALLAEHRHTTQFKKGDPINKGRVRSPQAKKNLERKRNENTAISATDIFRKKRKEAERLRKLQEQMENQD